MRKLGSFAGAHGNNQYEGFVVDLANEISKIVGFNFTISIASAYGSIDDDGQWNGMILELLEQVTCCTHI